MAANSNRNRWNASLHRVNELQDNIYANMLVLNNQIGDFIVSLAEQNRALLYSWADTIDQIKKGTNWANLGGSLVGVVAGSLTIAAIGLMLSPFTFGGSAILGLAIAGGVAGGGGAITGISASVTRLVKNNKYKQMTQENMRNFIADVGNVKSYMEKFHDVNQRNMEVAQIDYNQYPWNDGYVDKLQHLLQYVSTLGGIHDQIVHKVVNQSVFQNGAGTMSSSSSSSSLMSISLSSSESSLLSSSSSTSSAATSSSSSSSSSSSDGREASNVNEDQDNDDNANALGINQPELEDLVRLLNDYAEVREQIHVLLGETQQDFVQSQPLQVEQFDANSSLEIGQTVGTSVKVAVETAGQTGNIALKFVDDAAGAAGVVARAGSALKVFGITMAALGMAFDVLNIGLTSRSIDKGSKSKLAAKLREIADTLKSEMETLRQLHIQIQASEGVDIIEPTKYKRSNELLGEGGSKVYKGTFHGPVAIKCISLSRENQDAVKKEVKIASQLLHDNLGKVFGVANSRLGYEIIMEYINGQNLNQRLVAVKMTQDDKVNVIRQICTGLHYLHSCNVIHGDLKPDNIMISDGLFMRVKIVDFGLAKIDELASDEQTMSSSGSRKITPEGTIAYMAPELWDQGIPCKACDIWALGIIMAQVLTGVAGNPWGRLRTAQIISAVCGGRRPACVANISHQPSKQLVESCLNTEASERPSANDTLTQVLDVLSSDQVQTDSGSASTSSQTTPVRSNTANSNSDSTGLGSSARNIVRSRNPIASGSVRHNDNIIPTRPRSSVKGDSKTASPTGTGSSGRSDVVVDNKGSTGSASSVRSDVIVDNRSPIGSGSSVRSDVVVNNRSPIGSGSSVRSDVVVNNSSPIGSGSSVRSDVVVDNRSAIGSGSSVRSDVVVDNRSAIGSGSSVRSDVVVNNRSPIGSGSSVRSDVVVNNSSPIGSGSSVRSDVVVDNRSAIGSGSSVRSDFVDDNRSPIVSGSSVRSYIDDSDFQSSVGSDIASTVPNVGSHYTPTSFGLISLQAPEPDSGVLGSDWVTCSLSSSSSNASFVILDDETK